jgi:hypothetical protein
MSEAVALPERCAQRQRAIEMFDGLDAFCQHACTGALVVGQHHCPRASLIVVRPRLDEGHVEFDDVGRQHVEQRERVHVGAHVVECDGEALLPERDDLSEQVGRVGEQAPLGDFEDQPESLGAPGQDVAVGPAEERCGRLAIDEERGAGRQTGVLRATDGCLDAVAFQQGCPPGPHGVGEDVLTGHTGEMGPAGQRLVPDDAALG